MITGISGMLGGVPEGNFARPYRAFEPGLSGREREEFF